MPETALLSPDRVLGTHRVAAPHLPKEKHPLPTTHVRGKIEAPVSGWKSPSQLLVACVATRISFPEFADEPETYHLALTEAGIDCKMRSVSLEYPPRLLLERWP